MLSLLTLLIAFPITLIQAVITLPGVELTYYYDNTVGQGVGGTCAVQQKLPLSWQDGVLKDPGACGKTGVTYQGIGNNRMIAIGQTVFSQGICGNAARLIGPDGNEFKLDEGEFYVHDACQGCGNAKVDISAKALIGISGGICGTGGMDKLNMPQGWTVEILDRKANVVGGGGGGGVVTSAAPSIGTSIPPQVTTASIVQAQASSVSEVAGCACDAAHKGAEKCVDGQRALCNAITGGANPTYDWQVVGGACANSCNRRKRSPSRLT